MSIMKSISIQCDKCENQYQGFSEWMPRALRKAAKAEGWKVGKSKDFCPPCAEAIKQAVKEAAQGN